MTADVDTHPVLAGRDTDMFIAGSWRPAATGARFDVLNPATEEVLASVANGDIADMIGAIDAADDAAPSWRAMSPRERSECLRRTFELMREQEESFAELIVLENGKAFADALAEVRYAAEFFRWFAEEAVRVSGRLLESPSGANRIVVTPQPVGLALLITPWNYPAAMATRKIAPALAAGCTVVLKPASETPLTALAVARLLAEAGVPSGVVNVVTSTRSGAVASAALEDSRVRKLSFTGSTEVGRTLLAIASQQVISCSMELGGNAPFVVLEDADLDAAVEGAMLAKMRNGGEACTAANRFYVDAKVADEFSVKFAAAMSAVKVGPGIDRSNQLGPMVNAKARDKVNGLVVAAVAGGAKVLARGQIPDGPGYFVPPTVLVDVPHDSPILGEEIFGPIAPLVIFRTDEEALALANATEYGLVAYVYTRDVGHALRFSEGLEAGMVGINRGLVSDPAAPFGGMKQSGLGREGGHEGIEEYLELKYIAVDW